MSVFKSYWPGIIPAAILLFFPLSYFQNFIDIRFFVTIFTSTYIVFVLFVLSGTIIKNKKTLFVFINLREVYLYLFFLSIVLLFLSLFSPDVFFSTTRSIFSVFSLFLLFTIFYFVQYYFVRNYSWQRFFEVTSLLFLLYIILGQIFFSDWIWGDEIRLTGGLNPNSTAFFTTFFLFQSHINALLRGRWSKLQFLIWLLSFIIIIWTFSRSSILMIVLVYFIYTLYCATFRLLNGKINLKKVINFFAKFIVYSFIVLSLFLIGSKSDFYTSIIDRLTGIENVTARINLWNDIIPLFKNNPITGSEGWWGIHNDLAAKEGVSNAHNLFVRLLAEVGLLGLVSVLIFPIAIITILLLNTKKLTSFFQTPIAGFLLAVLFSIFVSQFFEDIYLAGIFDFKNNIIIWFMSLGLILYHLSVNKNNFRSKEDIEIKTRL